jgi:hypothetical protein
MTQPDPQRIRDAFDWDLAGYQAPADFPQRARAAGLRRARRRRARRLSGVAAVACAAAAAVVAIVPQAGDGRAGRGDARPDAGQPVITPPTASSAGPAPVISRTAVPSAASVSRDMLASFSTLTGDILYESEVSSEGRSVVDEYLDWFWPAQPGPDQQVVMRELFAQRNSRSARALPLAEDWQAVYTAPIHPPSNNIGFTASMLLTMVCYPPGSGCGYGRTQTPAGTWSKVRILDEPEVNDLTPGEGSFNPPDLAQAIAQGQWRVLGRTWLDGQQAIELAETPSGPMFPPQVDLWVNAQTYLPLKYVWGSGDGTVTVGSFAYLPPTPANLKSLQVPIPRGYPRSDPLRG